MDIHERMMAELPRELTRFLDTLTGNEIRELQKIDGHLIAKIYQAGATFSIEVGLKLAKERAGDES